MSPFAPTLLSTPSNRTLNKSKAPVSPVAPEPESLLPTRITRYRLTPDEIPVDFFADPDGSWDFSSLVEMAGFSPEHPGASVGALKEPFDGFPEGSAVITEVGVDCRYVALAQLPKGTSPQRGETRVSRRHRAA